jgi:hypothetical protein
LNRREFSHIEAFVDANTSKEWIEKGDLHIYSTNDVWIAEVNHAAVRDLILNTSVDLQHLISDNFQLRTHLSDAIRLFPSTGGQVDPTLLANYALIHERLKCSTSGDWSRKDNLDIYAGTHFIAKAGCEETMHFIIKAPAYLIKLLDWNHTLLLTSRRLIRSRQQTLDSVRIETLFNNAKDVLSSYMPYLARTKPTTDLSV